MDPHWPLAKTLVTVTTLEDSSLFLALETDPVALELSWVSELLERLAKVLLKVPRPLMLKVVVLASTDIVLYK